MPSVSHKMFEDGIGYVHIDSFETETAAQFEEAVKDLEDQGMKALIIDVRYNPGGMVTAVVQILDDILPEGTVVYTEDKNGNRQDYTSSGDTCLDYPIAVLINGESASASEILAGAIKDYQYRHSDRNDNLWKRNCADNLPVGGWGRSEAYDCQIFLLRTEIIFTVSELGRILNWNTNISTKMQLLMTRHMITRFRRR